MGFFGHVSSAFGPPSRVFEQARGSDGCGWRANLLYQSNREQRVVVQGLPLGFRASEVVVVGANPLRHSNHEWEGGGWQARPPTQNSGERGGGGGGHKSPPPLKSRVGGWWLAGKASHSKFE